MAFSFELGLAISVGRYGAISAGPEQPYKRFSPGKTLAQGQFTCPEHLNFSRPRCSGTMMRAGRSFKGRDEVTTEQNLR